LAQEVAYCKKEVHILSTEQSTVESVAITQCSDIQRYLTKETNILEDVINKASMRQKAEYSRFYSQCQQTNRMRKELDDERVACVVRVDKVQEALGVSTENMERFKMPLSNHIGGSSTSKGAM
jgi:hypothetical protein